MASVKPANRDLEGSVVTQLTGLAAWLPQLPEMLLLCNEAVKVCDRSIDASLPCRCISALVARGAIGLAHAAAVDCYGCCGRVVGRSSTRSPHSHLC